MLFHVAAHWAMHYVLKYPDSVKNLFDSMNAALIENHNLNYLFLIIEKAAYQAFIEEVFFPNYDITQVKKISIIILEHLVTHQGIVDKAKIVMEKITHFTPDNGFESDVQSVNQGLKLLIELVQKGQAFDEGLILLNYIIEQDAQRLNTLGLLTAFVQQKKEFIRAEQFAETTRGYCLSTYEKDSPLLLNAVFKLYAALVKERQAVEKAQRFFTDRDTIFSPHASYPVPEDGFLLLLKELVIFKKDGNYACEILNFILSSVFIDSYTTVVHDIFKLLIDFDYDKLDEIILDFISKKYDIKLIFALADYNPNFKEKIKAKFFKQLIPSNFLDFNCFRSYLSFFIELCKRDDCSEDCYKMACDYLSSNLSHSTMQDFYLLPCSELLLILRKKDKLEPTLQDKIYTCLTGLFKNKEWEKIENNQDANIKDLFKIVQNFINIKPPLKREDSDRFYNGTMKIALKVIDDSSDTFAELYPSSISLLQDLISDNYQAAYEEAMKRVTSKINKITSEIIIDKKQEELFRLFETLCYYEYMPALANANALVEVYGNKQQKERIKNLLDKSPITMVQKKLFQLLYQLRKSKNSLWELKITLDQLKQKLRLLAAG